jgi:hypothetical protein
MAASRRARRNAALSSKSRRDRTQAEIMWKALWQKWTIDKPARLGDWLWDVFVVQFAAFLNRLTFRPVVAFIAAAILLIAYSHEIPISPAFLFIGDLLAYIDIFAVLFLLGMLSRVTAVLFVVKQAVVRSGRLALGLMTRARLLDFRHRRTRGATGRKRQTGRPGKNDDEPALAGGLAWA